VQRLGFSISISPNACRKQQASGIDWKRQNCGAEGLPISASIRRRISPSLICKSTWNPNLGPKSRLNSAPSPLGREQKIISRGSKGRSAYSGRCPKMCTRMQQLGAEHLPITASIRHRLKLDLYRGTERRSIGIQRRLPRKRGQEKHNGKTRKAGTHEVPNACR